ncbi:MAG TPA: thiosulfate oxidation carrier protein SoxY, partial [Burkholderiales bacterium]
MKRTIRAWIRTLAAALLAAGLAPLAALAAEPAADPWPQLRTLLFAERPISEDAAAVIELETPVRAEDAAVVPIAIRAKAEQSPEKYIRKIYLVI